MTITKNADGTLTVTLTTAEKRTLVWANQNRGEDSLRSHVEQWFTAQRAAKLADNKAQLLDKYSALTPAQQAQVDAILATAVA